MFDLQEQIVKNYDVIVYTEFYSWRVTHRIKLCSNMNKIFAFKHSWRSRWFWRLVFSFKQAGVDIGDF